MNKIGIDTNILIYTFESSSPFHNECHNILKNKNNQLYTTSKNISEYFSVCTKLEIHLDKILTFYKEIQNNITILFPNEKSITEFENLFCKYKPIGNRVYDIEVISVLISNDIDKIATKNVKDFKNIKEIEVISMKKYE